MTLHEAIDKVLSAAGKELSAANIAEEINRLGLYKRSDISPISSSQILSRATKYPVLFSISKDKKIHLNKSLEHLIIELRNYISILPQGSGKPIRSDVILILLFLIRLSNQKNLQIEFKLNDATNDFENINSENIHQVYKDTLNHICTQLKIDISLTYLSNSKHTDKFIDEAFRIINHYKTKLLNSSDKAFLSFFRSVAIGLNRLSVSNMSSTPTLLTKLLSELFTPKDNDSILDPFAGYSGILTDIYQTHENKTLHFNAWEIHAPTAIIGYITLLLSGIKNPTFEITDSLTKINNNPTNIKFDWIVSVPPFRYSPSDKNLFTLPDIGIVDNQFGSIILALQLLKSNGEAIIVVPDSILSSESKSALQFRKYLIDNSYLKNIISLPNNVFLPYSNLKCSIIILKKSEKKDLFNVYFSFIKDDYFKQINKLYFEDLNLKFSNYLFDIKNITLNEPEIKYEKQTLIENNIIKHFNYDLNPNKYLNSSLNIPVSKHGYQQIKDVIKFSSVGIFVDTKLYQSSGKYPYIRIKDLSDQSDINKFQTADVFISDTSNENISKYIVQKGSVLVALKGNKLKPTIYNSEEPAITSKGIMSIILNYEQITPEYLILQLQQPYFEEQLNQIRSGTYIPYLRSSEFLKLLIKVPSLEEQNKELVRYYGNRTEESKNIDLKTEKEIITSFVGITKHSMSQPLSAISHELNRLNLFIKHKVESGDPLSWNDNLLEFEKVRNKNKDNSSEFTLNEVLSRLQKNINLSLEHLKKAESFARIQEKTEKTLFSINKFIHDEVKVSFPSEDIEFKITGDEFHILADPYQIRTMFLNLIDNSLKHGFSENDGERKKIIEIQIRKGTGNMNDYLHITFQNNGKPFPPGFSFEKYISKNTTSNSKIGTGFGGFLINQIVLNHQGSFELNPKINDPLDPFQVSFNIYLPL